MDSMRKLVAELRGEDTKGFRNYIVSRSPSVKWRPVRTEPSISKCRRCWSRDSEDEPYTPWHNRAVSVAYPLHIRFISVAFPWSAGSPILPTVNPGKGTDMLRLCHGLYGCTTGCAAVVDWHLRFQTVAIRDRNRESVIRALRLVTEKLKFSNNLNIVSLKKEHTEARRFIPVYPGSLRSCLR